jgi:spermidine/putrescine transport system permease protein
MMHGLSRAAIRRGFAAKTLLGLWTALVYLFLYVPIAVLVVTSFSTGRVTQWPPPGYTLEWYGAFLGNPRALHSIYTSLGIALVTMACSTALATLVGYGLTHFEIRRRAVIDSLVQLPLIVSPLIIGIALVLYFHLIRLPLGYPSVIVAHVVRTLPFTTLIMLTSFLGVRRSLIEAAMDLGAGRASTFRRVIFPAVLPGVVASALLAFTISFDEISSTYFVVGGGLTTVQMYILEQIEFVITPEMNALTSAILFFSSTLITIAWWIQLRLRRREGGSH